MAQRRKVFKYKDFASSRPLRLVCNQKSCFYACESEDFLKIFRLAPKYRKHARIKFQGSP